MALKIYLLKLKEKDTVLKNKRNVEHLYVKYSGVRISLRESIDLISSVVLGREMEVLFNTNKIQEIENAFLKHNVIVCPKKV
ncbi:MAG: hypothetical protein MK207_08580 [Saprospiraceae bacterium]|nr:hypothetical protein [Saprospiraceae bacterium]